MRPDSASCVHTRDVAFCHVRLLYCLVTTLALLQTLGFCGLYSYVAQVEVNCEEATSAARAKRETPDVVFEGNQIGGLEDKGNQGRSDGSKKTEKSKNVTKILNEDDDGMIIIGHSTRIPVSKPVLLQHDRREIFLDTISQYVLRRSIVQIQCSIIKEQRL